MRNKQETQFTWLTVGGCPRSGTTALGSVLNAHPKISLLHEYDQSHFFTTVSGLFKEEDRLGKYPETDEFELVPRRARHEVGIVRAIFREITGKDGIVLGTKFPGVHLWPQPLVPKSMIWKSIHITREPYSVIASYAKKMLREKYSNELGYILDTACAHWISAWNYAFDRQNSPNFMHLVYEELSGNKYEACRIANFLGIEPSIDFGSFSSKNKDHTECLNELTLSGFDSCLYRMTGFQICNDWKTFVANRTRLGFPIRLGEVFYFSIGGNYWKLPLSGFYPPESDGQWINGSKAVIYLASCFSCQDCRLTFEIPWALDTHGEPAVIEIEINGVPYVKAAISLGETNGCLQRFQWVLPGVSICVGQQLALVIRVLNPRNPKKLGIANDDRELSIMIRSIRFDAL